MITNILIWFLMLVTNFFCIIYAYKAFGKLGLYIWVPISTIVANIQVVMLVNIFGLNSTLGNILYAGGFLITDILSENYGKKSAQLAVKIGFFSLVATTLIMQIAIHFIPLSAGIEIFNSVKNIFQLLPRLAIASLTAYLVSQFHDVWLYEVIRNKFPSRKFIWLRNNGSTMISQVLDNIIFSIIAFYGIFPNSVVFEIFISTYVIKFIVSICDTPFVYLADYLYKNKLIKEN